MSKDLDRIDMPEDVTTAVSELRRVLSAHAMAFGLLYIGVKERPEGIVLMAEELLIKHRIAMLTEIREACDKIITKFRGVQ